MEDWEKQAEQQLMEHDESLKRHDTLIKQNTKLLKMGSKKHDASLESLKLTHEIMMARLLRDRRHDDQAECIF